MKPKIADIEGCHRILSEGDDPSTTILITMTECAALLRIARAAKEAQGLLVSEDAADAAIHHAYDSALDAFDWGEK